MTLLLRMVGELLWGSVVWLTIVGAVTGVVALVAVAVTRGRLSVRPALAWSAGIGILVMALAHRLGLPDPAVVSVWRRDILLLWAVVGAAAGSIAAAVRSDWPPARAQEETAS